MRFEFIETAMAGLRIVRRKPHTDERGFLCRLYCAEAFAAAGMTVPIAQINHTLTRRAGAVRGLHFQYPPRAETKLVSCLAGAVFDVAIDLRRGSPTFLQWHAERLAADNDRSLLIPQGFAHGFQALEPDSELLYLHTAPYDPDAEGALHAQDPKLAIEWPLAITELSERDSRHPMIADRWTGVAL